MKKFFTGLLGLSVILLFLSCTKEANCPYSEPTKIASAAEISDLQNYINTNGISASQHPSGVFYTIVQNGSNSAPNICSVITAKYKGTLLSNGTVFDSTAANAVLKIELGQLIEGWQRGLPLIRTGGKINLYIPPSLGYGSAPYATIPANSYLKFEVELVNVE